MGSKGALSLYQNRNFQHSKHGPAVVKFEPFPHKFNCPIARTRKLVPNSGFGPIAGGSWNTKIQLDSREHLDFWWSNGSNLELVMFPFLNFSPTFSPTFLQLFSILGVLTSIWASSSSSLVSSVTWKIWRHDVSEPMRSAEFGRVSMWSMCISICFSIWIDQLDWIRNTD